MKKRQLTVEDTWTSIVTLLLEHLSSISTILYI